MLIGVVKLNKTVEGLVIYFDSLASLVGKKSLEHFNNEEIEIEADIVLNYIKFYSETVNEIVDCLELVTLRMSDSMSKEEENENFGLALGYGLVVTKIISKVIGNVEREITNKKKTDKNGEIK